MPPLRSTYYCSMGNKADNVFGCTGDEQCCNVNTGSVCIDAQCCRGNNAGCASKDVCCAGFPQCQREDPNLDGVCQSVRLLCRLGLLQLQAGSHGSHDCCYESWKASWLLWLTTSHPPDVLPLPTLCSASQTTCTAALPRRTAAVPTALVPATPALMAAARECAF